MSSCEKDSDCVVTAVRSCCAACLEPPYAISRKDLGARNDKCAVVECAKPHPPPGGCPKVELPNAYHAACDAHRCVAIKN